MKLFSVTYFGGYRVGYVIAKSHAQAVAKVKKGLKNSNYFGAERDIVSCTLVAATEMPGFWEGRQKGESDD